jgi:hypothetical protein
MQGSQLERWATAAARSKGSGGRSLIMAKNFSPSEEKQKARPEERLPQRHRDTETHREEIEAAKGNGKIFVRTKRLRKEKTHTQHRLWGTR